MDGKCDHKTHQVIVKELHDSDTRTMSLCSQQNMIVRPDIRSIEFPEEAAVLQERNGRIACNL